MMYTHCPAVANSDFDIAAALKAFTTTAAASIGLPKEVLYAHLDISNEHQNNVTILCSMPMQLKLSAQTNGRTYRSKRASI